MRSNWKRVATMALCVMMTGLMTACESDNNDGDGTPPPSAGANPFVGSYAGAYSGDDVGTWTLQVAEDGAITGRARSSDDGEEVSVFGALDEDGQFTATVGGGASDGTLWTGRIAADGTISGTWLDPLWDMSGTFSGRRN